MRLFSALFGVRETITVLKISMTVSNFRRRYHYIKSDDLDCDITVVIEHGDNYKRTYEFKERHFYPYDLRELVSDYLSSLENVRLIDHQTMYRRFDMVPNYPVDFTEILPHGEYKQIEIDVKFIPDGQFVK